MLAITSRYADSWSSWGGYGLTSEAELLSGRQAQGRMHFVLLPQPTAGPAASPPATLSSKISGDWGYCSRFGWLTAVALLYFWRVVPETKGGSL
jgi:hypothetical protein